MVARGTSSLLIVCYVLVGPGTPESMLLVPGRSRTRLAETSMVIVRCMDQYNGGRHLKYIVAMKLKEAEGSL